MTASAEARGLTMAVGAALHTAFPEVSFTVDVGVVPRRDRSPVLRGHAEWTNGPAVDVVREVIRSIPGPEGAWVCPLRRYTPAWVKEMSECHGLKVLVSVSGYDHTALIHPRTATPEAQVARKRLIEILDSCTAPVYRT